MNSDSFKDKIVLITGGGQGIGKGIALAFAKEGASLAIIGRNPAALEETQKEIIGIWAGSAAISKGTLRRNKLVRKSSEK